MLSGVGMGAPLGADQDCGISLGLDSIASDSGHDDDVGDGDGDNENYENVGELSRVGMYYDVQGMWSWL